MDFEFEFEFVEVEHKEENPVDEGFRLFNTAPQKITEQEDVVVVAPERQYEVTEDKSHLFEQVAVVLEDIVNEAKAYVPQWVNRVMNIPAKLEPKYPKRKSKYNRRKVKESFGITRPSLSRKYSKKAVMTKVPSVNKKERHRKKKQ
ncbi:hypothetical protein HDV06_006459 [Boothiomyces sp. JEL0866]|nr:hypothetical protein HDV06_001240 [Boothiomyces sp. JEL0866]KAJ3324566.1 hypothetical protein HDV06_006459 [Boothiomyces sp. JEL0866]